jgi:uncharacterized protein (TIGR03086 family)
MEGGPLDFTSGDIDQNYEQAVKADVAGWQRPGALESLCRLPFGQMPGQFAIRLHFVENLVHGWDLATATGQDASLDPQLAAVALDMVRGPSPTTSRANRAMAARSAPK